MIQNPLASKLLRGEVLPGQTVHVSAEGDQLQFTTDGDAAETATA
jgi:ATP-dependent Clp protease ATP-binding subunit ClpA